jgi:glycosyltransferase involved in cell wall biosynthesis
MKQKRYVACVGFTFYKIAKLVNLNSDIEMHVFMTTTEMARAKNDFEFKESWVHEVSDNVINLKNLRRGKFWNKEYPNAELYLLTDSAPLFASAPKLSKSVFLPIGFDLTEQPFVEYAFRRGKKLQDKIKLVLLSMIQAERIRNVQEVWCSNFDVFTLSLRKLGYTRRFESFVPLPINYDAHKANNGFDFIKKEADFTIFFPGRVMTTKSKYDLQSGQTKGAEIAAQGFIDFTRIVKSRIELLIVDNSSSTDSVQIKKMFEENKVNHLVRWISPQEAIGRVSSEEMASIYRISDVILGDFGSNWFGQTALESAVHAKPFISKMDSDFMLENFQDNPFCLAADASEISLKLLELYENENARLYYGAKMHSWFNKNFDEDSISDWYRTQIERLLNYK